MDRVDPENGDGISESDVKVQGFWSQNVTKGHGDWILLLGCFATGLLDSAVFNVWSCFCSMLTGNTIYVGLGVSGQPLSQPLRWAKSGVAILSFMLGAFVFSRLMRRLGALSRKGLVVSLGLQAGITIVSAILSTTGIVPENAGDLPPDNWIVLLPISLLAIQAGGQCVLSRILGYPEVPSVVLTSSYCDLMMDEAVFAGPIYGNDKRRRRVGSIVIMVLGAIAGGYLTKGGDISNTLWIVAGIKLGMAGVWLVWKEDEGALRIE